MRDRLVYQALVNVLEAFFDRQFIYDSYSCRKGKGTHAGIKRPRKFLRQASHNNSNTVYALKCDVKQFFASVSHQKILNLLSIKITDAKTLDLLKEIIGSYENTPGSGIPLGNLTSQLFANIYMHELDFFVKQRLRQKYYVRYCDDFIIVDQDRDDLLALVEPTDRFLSEQLGLTIHPNKITTRSWEQGIDFLGYVLKPHCTILRTQTKNKMLGRVTRSNITSYLGLCSHASAYEIGQIMLSKIC